MSENALTEIGGNDYLEPGSMPLAMRIWFDDSLLKRVTGISESLAKATGFIPEHLLGKPNACFAVVVKSLVWRLDPYAVAASTYITPGGRIGYEGKLVHAILEASGKLVPGSLRYIHYHNVVIQDREGNRHLLRSTDPELEQYLESGGRVVEEHGWNRIQGKFRKQQSAKNANAYYAVPDWKEADEQGLGVLVRCQIKGEVDPREHAIDLIQAYPRNSTLWATDPKTQLCYLGVRRFANVAAPSLFMGTPFDREDDGMVDVTPPAPIEPTQPMRATPGYRPGPVTDVQDQSPPADAARSMPLYGADGAKIGSFKPARWLSMLMGEMRGKPAEQVIAVFGHNDQQVIYCRDTLKLAVSDIEDAYQDALDQAPAAAAEATDEGQHDPDTGEVKDDQGHQAPAAEKDTSPFDEGARSGPAASPSSGGGPEASGGGAGGGGEPVRAQARGNRNESFFRGESYHIQVPVTGKNKSDDWPKWIGWMESAAHDCAMRAEFVKLRGDNGRTLQELQIKQPDLYKPLADSLNTIMKRFQ